MEEQKDNELYWLFIKHAEADANVCYDQNTFVEYIVDYPEYALLLEVSVDSSTVR